jgi:hypothetical protein
MTNAARAAGMGMALLFGASAAAAGTLTAHTDGVTVELTSQPEQPRTKGKTSCTLRLIDPAGAPVTGAQVTLSGRMADGMSVLAPLRAAPEPGVYRGEVLFTMEGPWELRVRVARQGRRFELPFREQVTR